MNRDWRKKPNSFLVIGHIKWSFPTPICNSEIPSAEIDGNVEAVDIGTSNSNGLNGVAEEPDNEEAAGNRNQWPQ